jgi:serine/threonine protein phosphatase 1
VAIVSRVLLYCLILWAPLPLGSNRPVFWVVNGILASIILALFLLHEFRNGQRREVDWRLTGWILAGVSLWALWMVIQALPGVPAALQHPIWSTVADNLGASGSISVNPSSTLTTAVQVVPVVFVAIVAMRLAFERQRAITLLNVVIAATVTVATYGLVAQIAGWRQVFLVDEVAYAGFLTGTFIGRNAAAAYFALGLAAASSMLVFRFEEYAARAKSSGGLLATVDGFRGGVLYIFACIVLLAALVDTGSRGGIIAGSLALICVAGFWIRTTRLGVRYVLPTLALIAITLGAIFGATSGMLMDRLEAGVGDGNRFLAYLDTLDMIWARPLLGHGAGAFVDAFPLFQERAPANLVWNAAHNSYLQSVAELGLPVFAIVLASLLLALAVIARGAANKSSFSPAATAAIAACAATAFHASVDFAVQFQAVGLTLAVLIGAGLGEVTNAPKRRAKDAVDLMLEEAKHHAAASAALRARETVRVALPGVSGTFAGSSVSSPALEGPGPAQFDPTEFDDRRIYAFGDLHGRIDLLNRLSEAIAADIGENPADNGVLILGLGDYVDRGPDSRGVINALARGLGRDALFLRGNHEQMLLQFLEDPEHFGPLWFRFGAAETLQSYGVDVRSADTGSGSRYRSIRNELALAMDPKHLMFLQRLPVSFQTSTHFFAHAGARPGVPLDKQAAEDLLWMREGFVEGDHAFEKIVVHGHTPVEKPYFGKYRINLDTGAYFTNRLSCLVVEKGTARILGNTFQRGSELLAS